MKKLFSTVLTLLILNTGCNICVFAKENITVRKSIPVKLNDNMKQNGQENKYIQPVYQTSNVHETTVKSGTTVYLTPARTITSQSEPLVLPAVVKEDVVINGKTVFKKGSKAEINIVNSEKAGFFGNGGKIRLNNGYVTDINGNRHRVTYNYNIIGRDKTWAKVTCICGILIWPLLFFGFVKGKEAEALSTFEMEVETEENFVI